MVGVKRTSTQCTPPTQHGPIVTGLRKTNGNQMTSGGLRRPRKIAGMLASGKRKTVARRRCGEKNLKMPTQSTMRSAVGKEDERAHQPRCGNPKLLPRQKVKALERLKR